MTAITSDFWRGVRGDGIKVVHPCPPIDLCGQTALYRAVLVQRKTRATVCVGDSFTVETHHPYAHLAAKTDTL